MSYLIICYLVSSIYEIFLSVLFLFNLIVIKIHNNNDMMI